MQTRLDPRHAVFRFSYTGIVGNRYDIRFVRTFNIRCRDAKRLTLLRNNHVSESSAFVDAEFDGITCPGVGARVSESA